MSLTVLDPGLFTTIQDQGRPGSRSLGVPVGGAFDADSAGLANALLGNPADAAVLEMTLRGGRLRAEVPLAVALAGARMEGTVQSSSGRSAIPDLPAALTLSAGAILELERTHDGARTYLAVAGGFQTESFLSSRSSETPLTPGFVLPCATSFTPRRRLIVESPTGPSRGVLRVIAGPDDPRRAGAAFDLSTCYRVSAQSNRMGIRLEGPPWEFSGERDRLSAPVCAGAVQVAGGLPLILGVAGGTMGGYPHVLTVISADLGRLAQCRPGDTIRFDLVVLAEARRLESARRGATRRQWLQVATACGDRLPSQIPGPD